MPINCRKLCMANGRANRFQGFIFSSGHKLLPPAKRPTCDWQLPSGICICIRSVGQWTKCQRILDGWGVGEGVGVITVHISEGSMGICFPPLGCMANKAPTDPLRHQWPVPFWLLARNAHKTFKKTKLTKNPAITIIRNNIRPQN